MCLVRQICTGAAVLALQQLQAGLLCLDRELDVFVQGVVLSLRAFCNAVILQAQNSVTYYRNQMWMAAV